MISLKKKSQPLLTNASKTLLLGKPVIIHDADNREGECDLVFLADTITSNAVAQLRNEAGGLICACIPYHLASLTGIPFLKDILLESSKKYPLFALLTKKTLTYDTRSSFSITINHRDTRTGIPDNERTITLKKLAAFARHAEKILNFSKKPHYAENDLRNMFSREFYTPGHVFLLIGAPKLTRQRQGHTELSLALAQMATNRIFPVTVICEMLDDQNGTALSVDEAEKWAEKNGTIVIQGNDIIQAYENWSNQPTNAATIPNIIQNSILEAKKW